jgi:hypothetical protein
LPTNDPSSPLPGTDAGGTINGCSLPFFATANYGDGPSDYGVGGANNQTIEIPSGQDYAWAFYGCFLNVYDSESNWRADGSELVGRQRPQLLGVADCIHRRSHYQR